ncbi:MAG: ABC transporter ATP-binding protein, partial [Candidatus Cloacimonetes bacterium]|nr:ABC transporter ATP-binding protein [Candidatus Cloacimonadota bacterium]
MKDVIKIYKAMLRYWGYLVTGLVFMLSYAFFSGISITMAIPFFDYVFQSKSQNIIYRTFPAFLQALQSIINDFLNAFTGFKAFFQQQTYQPLLNQLKELLSATDPYLLLWMISISIVTLILLKNISFYGNRIMFANLRGLTTKDIRSNIFRKYLFQSMSFFGKNKVGDSLVRMVSDVQIVSDLFIGSLLGVLRNIILLLVNAFIALLLNPRLFIISLVLLPVFSYLINYLGKKIKKYAKRIQGKSSEMFSDVEETLNSMRIVKGFSREDHELGKFNQINNKYFRFWRKSLLYESFSIPLSEMNSTLMGVIVLIVGGRQVLSPESSFTAGYFVTFMLAIFSMLHPLKEVTKAYTEIRRALVSLGRISEILNRSSEIVDHPDALSKNSFDKRIEYRNVSFSYENGSEVLSNVSFIVNKGEKVAIIGASGSGKTTLVNLLPRMYDHKSGLILIDGIPIEDIRLRDLRNLFGTVTQESILFSDTVANNIRYGSLQEVSEEEISRAAEIAYAAEFIERLPARYETVLDARASNLSGGQQQRLCIARAIVGDPPILIFDEATSALDTEAEIKVQQAIEQATRNRTVIVIAHRLSTILSSDKIIVLDKGRIVGEGKHEELILTCEKYKLLYEL